MQVRVLKFDIPIYAVSGSDAVDTVFRDANNEDLPDGATARAVIAVANRARSLTGTTATSPNLNGSVGFGIFTFSSTGAAFSCISFTSRGIENPVTSGDDDSVTAAKRRGVSGVPIFMQDPYDQSEADVGGGNGTGAYAMYAEVKLIGSAVQLHWHGDIGFGSGLTYGGGTVLLKYKEGVASLVISKCSHSWNFTELQTEKGTIRINNLGEFSSARGMLVHVCTTQPTPPMAFSRAFDRISSSPWLLTLSCRGSRLTQLA